MMPTEELAARFSDRVELVSPHSAEECLHNLHIGLASSRRFAGKVDATTVSIQRLQETGMAVRGDVRRPGHLALRLTVEPLGTGARLHGKAVWPAFAKAFIAFWMVGAAFIGVQGIGELIHALIGGGSPASAAYQAAIGVAFPVGMAIYLGYRFDKEKRDLVGFVMEATKARPAAPEQRRRITPIVE